MLRMACALLGALSLTACPDDDDDTRDAGADGGVDLPVLVPVLEELDGAILSIWGPDASDVFAVGGDPPVLPDQELHAFILWSDGQAWYRMQTDAPTLWWVFGLAHDDVWAVGELGTIVHFDGAAWTTVETGADYALYGIWGSATDDIWTVGGAFLPSTHGAFRHWDGQTWTDVEGVDLEGRFLFKAWGASADDVWVVGHSRGAGLALHWDGAAWQEVETPANERLVTVVGRASNDVWAVGGLAEPVLIHWNGTEWSSIATPDLYEGIAGVWTAPGQPVFMDGSVGLFALVTGESDVHAMPEVNELDYHAAWGDSEGRLLAGGGALMSATNPRGVILGYGEFPTGPLQDWP